MGRLLLALKPNQPQVDLGASRSQLLELTPKGFRLEQLESSQGQPSFDHLEALKGQLLIVSTVLVGPPPWGAQDSI